MRRGLITVIILALIIGGIVYLESRKVDRGSGGGKDSAISVSGMTAEQKAQMYEVGKEISTPDAFINVKPNPEDGQVSISVAGEIEKGNIVLIDFWTYSCINCQRTLPYLRAWHEQYADQGLTIIGIHTPEFDFEKELANVQRAVDQFNVPYPVVLDNDFSTWQAYNNRYWPRKYLIDVDGFIVYDHIGEGGYEATEAKIVELLEERAGRLDENVTIRSGSGPEGVDEVNFGQVGTPEIYFGYDRLAYIANLPNTSCFDKECEYIAPSELALNMFSLDGSWQIGNEEATLVSEEGSIAVGFSAGKVNLVAEAVGGPVEVEVFLDGESTDTITVDEAGLYNVVDLGGEYGEHILELRIKGSGLSAFTFTFG